MGNDWIVDVLADLRSFAQKNDLPVLAAHLTDTACVAQAEIAQTTPTVPLSAQGEAAATRSVHIQTGASRRS